MKRDECWMTFSEALEVYLLARENAASVGAGRNRDEFLEEMRFAAAHMDALTGGEE